MDLKILEYKVNNALEFLGCNNFHLVKAVCQLIVKGVPEDFKEFYKDLNEQYSIHSFQGNVQKALDIEMFSEISGSFSDVLITLSKRVEDYCLN